MRSIHTAPKGVTLLELLTVVLLLGILAVLAIPALTAGLQRQAVKTAALRLWNDLRLARSTALKTGLPVTLCAAAGAKTTGYQCADSPRWHQGWLLFIDRNKNARREATEKLLSYQPPLPRVAISASRRKAGITYTRFGATYFSTTTLTVCAAGTTARFRLALVIAASGRSRISKAAAPCRTPAN